MDRQLSSPNCVFTLCTLCNKCIKSEQLKMVSALHRTSTHKDCDENTNG